MIFDPTLIPTFHENPMYIMEQNQRYQHICDLVGQLSEIQKFLSSYVSTGYLLCSTLKNGISALNEIEFVCTNPNFGLILQTMNDFQASLKSHFKEIDDQSFKAMKHFIRKDFPDLTEFKKTHSKNIEKYYQVQDHYLSLPKKSKLKAYEERQIEYRKAFTESATSLFDYIIRLDATEARINNLIGSFMTNFPKSFINATQPTLEKAILTTKQIIDQGATDILCTNYESFEKKLATWRKEFLSSIPQYFQKINSHLSTPLMKETHLSPHNSEPVIGNASKSQNVFTSYYENDDNSNRIFSIGCVADSIGTNTELLTKQGYLWKRCGSIGKTWERKYFVCSQGVLSYSLSVETVTNPTNTIQLGLASVQPNDTEERPYVFNIVTQNKIYTLQAPSQLDFDEWVNVIQNGIAIGLSLDPDEDRIPIDHNDNVILTGSLSNFTELNPTPQQSDEVQNNSNDHIRRSSLTPLSPTNHPAHTVNFTNSGNQNSDLSLNSASTPVMSSFNDPQQVCSCADCGYSKADWYIMNIGLRVCDMCAGIHRSIPKVSTIRSLKLDKIDKYNNRIMQLLSINQINPFLETQLDQQPELKINVHSTHDERETFITKKYVEKLYVDQSFTLTKEKSHSHHKKDRRKSSDVASSEPSGIDDKKSKDEDDTDQSSKNEKKKKSSKSIQDISAPPTKKEKRGSFKKGHDVYEAIRQQDLLEIMKIAFVGGLQQSRSNFEPIHAAACIGNPVILTAIIENDLTSVDKLDDGNWSPLAYAAYYDNEKIVDALLSFKANVQLPNVDLAQHPYIIAKEMQHDNIAKKLQPFSTNIPNDALDGTITFDISPPNTDFTPVEILPEMIIHEEAVNSLLPMTDDDMNQIQQAFKNMTKKVRGRRRSIASNESQKTFGILD